MANASHRQARRWSPRGGRTRHAGGRAVGSAAATAAAGCLMGALEPRQLLSFSANVNFQPGGAPVPSGYLADTGAVYANRGNGHTYGWNADNRANARDRNATADQRYDTLVSMQRNGNFSWEMAVPNGTYQVHIVSGDPSATDSAYRVNVEGSLAVSGTPSAKRKWFEADKTVVVGDGKLTVSNASGAVNNKINYLRITQVVAALAAPTNLSAAAVSPTQVNLTWTDNSSAESGFRVYRSDGAAWGQVGAVGANVTRFTDAAASPGKTYSYYVKAFRNGTASASSNTAAATTPSPATPANGLTATYYDNADLTAPVLTRVDPGVDFNWGAGAPAGGMGADTYSVRWTGQVQPARSETYTFTAAADDGARVWVDNLLVVDNWNNPRAASNSGLINLQAGKKYDLRVEYYEQAGDAAARLLWSSASQPQAVVPAARLFAAPGPQREERVIYVDNRSAQAADTNSGAPAAPLKTLGRAAQVAVDANRQNIATRVIIQPGTYRESLTLWRTGTETEAPITFQAATKGTVVIDGADVWTGWRRTEGDVYAHAWTGRWGVEPAPADWPDAPEVLRRREMLFINGVLLRQVLSSRDLGENSFFVDDAGGQVYMRVAPGTDVAAATVEWGMRDNLVHVDGKKNVTLSGLVVQHDTSAFWKGQAVGFPNSSNVLLEDSTVRWNSHVGVSNGYARNIVMRRNVIDHNGSTGVGGAYIKSAVMEDVQANHNNWRGALAGYGDWDLAGIKNLFIHDAVYRNLTVADNQTYGLWLDTDATNILIDRASIHGNARDGVFLEASQGPITIRNSTICHNQFSGILGANAADVTLSGNVLYGNKALGAYQGAQIAIWGRDDGRWSTDWETGQATLVDSKNWKIHDNQIVGTAAKELGLFTFLSPAPWQKFVDTLSADRNLWYNPQTANVFRWWNPAGSDLAGWRAFSHHDAGSVFADPKYVDPANHDFTRQP